MAHLDLVTLIVKDYDPAIDFFVRVLRFELVEDVPSSWGHAIFESEPVNGAC